MSRRQQRREPAADRLAAALLGGDDAARVDAKGVDSTRIGLTSAAAAKVVAKHWGEERWLVHGDAPFVFKLIRLRKGTRTSLQMHQEKEEANLVLSGVAELVYQSETTGALERRVIRAGSVVHVRPTATHRLEAVTDVIVVEVSTPEVDDVVRLSDDWHRPDGRIDCEHLR